MPDLEALSGDQRLLNLARSGAAPPGMGCAELHKLTMLSMLMTDRGEDDILTLAAAALAALAPGTRPTFHLSGRGWWPAAPEDGAAQLATLAVVNPRVPTVVQHEPVCRYVLPVRSLGLCIGHLILDAGGPLDDEVLFAAQVLAQQLAVAVDNARRHAREARMAAELARLNERLAEQVREMERLLRMHEKLAAVAAAGGDMEAVVAAVAGLTGCPVAVEDAAGAVLASAGGWAEPRRPSQYTRARMLDRLRREPRPVRDDGCIAVISGPHRADADIILRLADPDAASGEFGLLVLEHAAMVLSRELARSASVAEAELRLRRDLTEELLLGMPEPAAHIRADALGIDLTVPRRVVVIRRARTAAPGEHADELLQIVRRCLARLGEDCLPVTRGAQVVCLAGSAVDWQAVFGSLRADPAGGPCWIGVGGVCDRVADFPTSLRQARQALGLADRSGASGGVTRFDDLGVYRLLATSGDPEELDRYVHQWLGDLLEQDRARSSDLVRTLAEYLHSGGSIAITAEKLNIHRSTVKYRLQRIRDISALDLSDPATVFALQLAVHALETRDALFAGREDERI